MGSDLARPGTALNISTASPIGSPYRWHLERNPRSIRAARREVRQKLEDRQVPSETIDVVELLTSEVVTNAIVHASSAPAIELAVSDDRVRVGVSDESLEQPHLRLHERAALRGRGLHLVNRLAAFWGTVTLPNGRKEVWFEVSLDRRSLRP